MATLALFLTRDLFRSLSGVVPLAAAVAFGLIAFEYGMDQAQLVTVGGVGIGTICFLTCLLLASRANRAAFYPLLARLGHRGELLVAVVLSGLGITAVLSAGIVGANLLAGRLTLSYPSALWILPTWLTVWLLAAALGLLLSTLVSRGGSHLVGYALLVGLLVINDRGDVLRTRLASFLGIHSGRYTTLVERGMDGLFRAARGALWPISNLLGQASAESHGQLYVVALTLTLACATCAFAVAVLLFDSKDLLWAG
jgi:hypothetical protein